MMIRFVIGICMLVAFAGIAEGSGSLSNSILLGTIGSTIMIWGVVGMDERNLG